MKNKFLFLSIIIFLIYACFAGCQQPTSSGSHSDSGSSPDPKVISKWTGTAYSITNDTYSEIKLSLYDNNTFTGFNTNTGVFESSITGSYSISGDLFNGDGSGTTIVYGVGSDNFSVSFIGTVDVDTLDGGFELDYNNWPDEIGTFELTKE